MSKTAMVALLCIVSGAAGWLASRMVGPGEPPPAPVPLRPTPPAPPPAREEGTESPLAAPPAAGGSAQDGNAAVPASAAPAEAPPRSAKELELDALELQLKAMSASLRELGAGDAAPGTGPRDNPSRRMTEEERALRLRETRRKLDPILAAYGAAPAGPERGRLLREAIQPLQNFMEAGGGFEHLPLLEAAAEEGETAAERSAAVIALHRLWQAEVVDALLARSRSPHVEVRMYGFEGLLWVTGDETERALQGALLGLDDADPRVRGVVAAALPVVHRTPEHAELLLARLRREEDPSVAGILARGVLRLDPAKGRQRVGEVLAGLPPGPAREAVEEALGK